MKRKLNNRRRLRAREMPTSRAQSRTMTSIGDHSEPAAEARVFPEPAAEARAFSEPAAEARAWKLPMTGRDTAEPHRSSTPLELLFDLTFVVAVGRVAAELAHSIAADQ